MLPYEVRADEAFRIRSIGRSENGNSVFLVRLTASVMLALSLGIVLVLSTARAGPGPARLVYASARADRAFDLLVTWPGRPAPRYLARAAANETQPAWSPACGIDGRRQACRVAYLTTETRPDGATHRTLFSVRQDGTGRTNLSGPEAVGLQFAWSPDGQMIAVELRDDVRSDIVIIRAADGVRVARVTDDVARDMLPDWSPDGRRIAFISYRGTEAANQGKVMVATLDAAYQPVDLVALTPAATRDTLAGWSPDGQWVLYTSAQTWQPPITQPDIFITRADGSVTRQLTDDPAPDTGPVWSPDGVWIAFESLRDGSSEIYAVRPDGSDLHNVTRHAWVDVDPRWSPDSTWILARRIDGPLTHFVLVAPGGPPSPHPNAGRALFPHPARDWGAVWSPDGRWIAFESMRDGNREIYAVRPDGSGLVNLSRWAGVDALPAWSPPLVVVPFRPARLLVAGAFLWAVVWRARRVG